MTLYPSPEMTDVMEALARLLPDHAVLLIATLPDGEDGKVVTNLVDGRDMFAMLSGAITEVLDIMADG